MGAVTMLTDFGWTDPWVGQMKAALLEQWSRWPGTSPQPAIIDLGHDIPPGDIGSGRWFLERCWRRFPAGTVHLAVIDPGVGGQRAAVAVWHAGHFFVGPGNGLLEFAQGEDAVVVILDNPLYHRTPTPSATFHGRDIFAPVAAHLARGVPLEQVGNIAGPEALGAIRTAADEPFRIRWIDRFGNAITDLPRESTEGQALSNGGVITVGRHLVSGPLDYYAEGTPGSPFWYWGSAGTLEIALRQENAAEKLDLVPGLALASSAP